MMTVEVYSKKREANAFRRYHGVDRIIFLKEVPFLKIAGRDEKVIRFIRTDEIDEVVCFNNVEEDEE